MNSKMLEACLNYGYFSVPLFRNPICFGDEAIETEVHRRVLQPVIESADEIRLYGPIREPKLMSLVKPVTIETTPHYLLLNPESDLLGDYVRLWNASSWQRGSIVVVFGKHKGSEALVPAFERSYDDPRVWATKAMLMQTHTPSALAWLGDAVHRSGVIGCAFPASNGCEWLDVFAEPPTLKALFCEASAKGGKREIWPTSQW